MKSTQTKKHQTPPCSHPVFPHSLDSSFTCPRCQGLFVRVFCMDMYDGTGENGFWALRCLQCGELLDPLILEHRISKPHLVQMKRPRQQSPMALS